jgi:molybdate transport system substrate-binding protein
MFRGNIVMKGYLKNEGATSEAFAGGWFHTGDLGVLDEHGYVIIKDRSKDIIISGGENISSVAARAGAAKPDISSVDALKRTLLDARMIVYADPAKGGASGVYFAHVIDQLGIAEQLKSRTILVPGAQSAEVVAKGLADIGVAQGSEILPVPGVQLVGPLPGQFASTTVFTGGIGADTKVPEAAKSLLQFLKGPAGMAVFKSKGFEPE